MSEKNSKPGVRGKYEPPALLRVQVDPQQELLQTTGCGFGPAGDPINDCVAQGKSAFSN